MILSEESDKHRFAVAYCLLSWGLPSAIVVIVVFGGIIGLRFGTLPAVLKRPMRSAFAVTVNDPVLVVHEKLAKAEQREEIQWFALQDVDGGSSGINDPRFYEDRQLMARSKLWIVKTPRPHESIDIRISGGRVASIHNVRVLWPYSILDY